MTRCAGRKLRHYTAGIALASLILPTNLPHAAAAAADPAAARAELEKVVKSLNDLDSWLSEADAQRVRWQKEIKDQDGKVAELSNAAAAAEQELDAANAELQSLAARQQALEQQRHAQAQKIGQHLAAAQRLGGQDFIKLLLNQQSPETFDRMLRYHAYFSNARVDSLQNYQQTLAELSSTQSAVEEQAVVARERRNRLLTQQRALEGQRDQRRALIAELDIEREDKAVERERLRADRARLEALIAELNRRATTLDGSAFAAAKGKLPWPASGRLRATFGRPRADGRLIWHGMVVNLEEGAPINAVFRGRVVFADWLRGFGLLTIVDHGSGYMTLYGHADSLTKVVGDWVEAGELIARAGRSGGQSRSGLYFEIRQKGAAKDPLAWLTKRRS